MSTPDNDFATAFFKLVKWDQVKPSQKGHLCHRCKLVNSTQIFDSVCDLSRLKPQTCDLCKLLIKALIKENISSSGEVRLRQNGAVVGVENGSNLLSIYVEPGRWTFSWGIANLF